MSRLTKIIICTDLDGTIFKTEKFIEHIIKFLSKEKADYLDKKIQETRRVKGSSVSLPVIDIIGDELKNIKIINKQNYIYNDVKNYIENTSNKNFAIKHVILTHGEMPFQRLKVENSFLENLSIEIRSSNDKINFIKSMLTKQNKYDYKGHLADYCFLVDDKISSFKGKKDSFNTAKDLPNFKGFKISRQNEYNHNNDEDIPDFITEVSSLNQIQNYIKNMSVD